MPNNDDPSVIKSSWLAHHQEEDYCRGWCHWQHDLLRHLTGESPNTSTLMVFQQLCCQWREDWGRKYTEYCRQAQLARKLTPHDEWELSCCLSLDQLAALMLGVFSQHTIQRAVLELERVGILTTRKRGLGHTSERVLNRTLVEDYHDRWNQDPEFRATMIDSAGRLLVRSGDKWLLATSKDSGKGGVPQ